MNDEKTFNPQLFEYEPARSYRWQVFPRVTVATMTFNRLAHTRKFLESLYLRTHVPFELLVLDNASEDGTREHLRELEQSRSNVRLILNAKNVGLGRGLLQIRDAVDSDLLVFFDNDIEILSNYWLVHLQKAYHAYRLAHADLRVSLGLRMINQEEYGFRFASRMELLPIPAAQNELPRTSFSKYSKDDASEERRLEEEVVIGWTEHLCGGAWSCPVALYKQIEWERHYPKFLGGEDGFFTAECARAGAGVAYVENGPIVRHNDWPYTQEKIELYRRLTQTRAVTDWTLVKQKLWRLLGRRGASS
ncbi:MAG: glycosyltransferase family 2 protein [Planctomycetes bacterium]|nr:glycosyltransferase family 2 protein [Planctomycetota bacterium]